MTEQSITVINKWKIIEMGMWGQDFVNAEMDGYFNFRDDATGEFHFGYVHGYMTCHYSAKLDYVSFSWEGSDEMDEASGEGDGLLEGGVLNGSLSFDNGDETFFKAIAFKP
jgi:hypothetical protein